MFKTGWEHVSLPNLSPSPGNWFPSLCSMTLEVRAPAPRFSFDFAMSQRDLISSSQIILPMNAGGKKTKHNLKKKNPEKTNKQIGLSLRMELMLLIAVEEWLGISIGSQWTPIGNGLVPMREAQCGAKSIHFRRISKRAKEGLVDEMIWCAQSRSQRDCSPKDRYPETSGNALTQSALVVLLSHAGNQVTLNSYK